MITLEKLQERPLSYSSLKEFAKSPKHYLDYLNRTRETTPAMLFGSMIHCLLLEPFKFDEQFAVIGNVDRRTTEGKKAYADFLDKAAGKDVVSESDYNEAKNIVNNAMTNQDIASAVNGCHSFEQEFRTEIFELPVRGFFDGVADDYILEVKTTNDATPKTIINDFYNRFYHMQAGLYNHVSQKPIKYLIIETKAPYDSYLASPSDDYIENGKNSLFDNIEAFKYCMEYNEFNRGYDYHHESPFIIDLPKWAK